jgi:CheY-like chemotaxis protein
MHPPPPFTVLIVEDDPNDVRLLQRALRDNAITNPVKFMQDGQEAISYLEGAGQYSDREAYPYPGLLIIDLKMPRKSGMEVLIWLKDHPECYVIPAIIFTSSDQLIDVKLSYGHGANSYIVKPGTFEELKRTIRIIFEYWALCQKLTPDLL